MKRLVLFAMVSLPVVSWAGGGGVYGAVGLPGVMAGYAAALSEQFTVRGDYATLGSKSQRKTYEGLDYDAKAKVGRFGLFADWFPAGNGFRLTGGVTFNDMKVDLHFQGSGQAVTIGNRTVVTDASDRFDAQVKMPNTTPYIGIGWGHQPDAGHTGFGFVADLGVSIGKAKVTGTASDSLKAKGVTQADIDQELQNVRDDVAKLKVIPQLSVGVSYQF